MKKISILFSILCTSAILWGQTQKMDTHFNKDISTLSPSELKATFQEIYSQVTKPLPLRHKSTATIKHRLDSTTYEVYDINTSQWSYDGKLREYTYNLNEQLTELIYYTTSSFSKDTKSEYDYNATGELSDHLQLQRNSPATAWKNYRKLEYIYDNSGKTDHYITMEWDSINAQWQNFEKSEYLYNANASLDTIITYSWDKGSNQWADAYITEHFYDSNGNLTQILQWENSSGQWEKDYKNTFQHNSSNQVITFNSFGWDVNSSQWRNAFEGSYTYDANGNPSIEEYKHWDDVAMQWNNIAKIEYDYDLTYTLSDLLLPNLSYLLPDYSTNITNMLTSALSSSWDINTGQWVLWDKMVYQYSLQNDISLSASKIDAVSVYPNPTTDLLLFDIDTYSTSVLVELYSLSGECVLSRKLPDSHQLAIGHLESGTYIYKFFYDNKIHRGKIVIE